MTEKKSIINHIKLISLFFHVSKIRKNPSMRIIARCFSHSSYRIFGLAPYLLREF
ncbi:uncharacterized protein METZ01_LOCUS502023 [marine metagenome]|uniref:Uncharacterized protein n=1 Tax=marine metagenome TaxID=408172 RepID=A0A383DXU5_9ZZZZ